VGSEKLFLREFAIAGMLAAFCIMPQNGARFAQNGVALRRPAF
jgi:hypothetical protein